MRCDNRNGPRDALTSEGLDTEGVPPMSSQVSHGAASREPVFSGNRRIPGLYARTRADGSTVYDVALRLGGKVRRHRLTATTKTDAIAELRALQTDYRRGEEYRSPAAAVTVSELAADYLADLEARVGHRDPTKRRSARTVELYRDRLRLHVLPALGHVPASELRASDLRRIVSRLGHLAPGTVSSVLSIVSGMLRYGVKAGALERNVARDLDRDDRPGVKRETEPRYLTAAEVSRLLAELSDTFRPVAATCAYAGLRVSEALGLRWRDIDLKAGTLTVSGQLGASGERLGSTKTRASAASVELLPALALEFRAHRSRQASHNLTLVHRDALVFTTARGKPQSRRNALRAVHTAGDKAGLNGPDREPVGLHDLRHSLVGAALASGLSLAEAAVLARHASTRVTATMYAGVADGTRETLTRRLADAGYGS
jgi:integrase